MAGITKQGDFPEKISKFLRAKIEEIAQTYGKESPEYRAVALQYLKNPQEGVRTEEHNQRHWEADLQVESEAGEPIIHGMERLYYKSIVVEPTMICSSHCRYCLRGNYNVFNLSEEELHNIAVYCGTVGAETGLNEILITGGDPVIVPQKLDYFVECLIELAPNIKIIRIATRLLTHDPARIGNSFYNILRKKGNGLRFEVATQINHAVEFFPETINVIEQIKELGAAIYSQNVLLKGVNDNIEALIDLYNKMRVYDIEPHYLFHCVPMKGMHHFRTTVDKGLRLNRELVNSGYLSGRSKPMYALMTDIGKVILYEDTIVGKKDGYIELKTYYKLTDRLKWNPSFVIPETASVDNDGYLRIRYLDGFDD